MTDTSVADLLGNLNQETTQGAVKTAVQSIDGKTPALVSGRVPVDGSGVTQPVSGTVTATQSGTWAQNLTKVNGASLSLGQKTAAGSLPVVLSSDGPFAVNFGLTTDSAVTDPSATASHMSLQKGQITKLASIDSGIGGASAAAAGDTGASTTNGFLRWLRDFWLSLKGTRTAANSVSVTGASDGVFYVGGVSADGVAPTNQAVRVSGVDGGGLKRTIRTDANGSVVTVTQPDTTSSGTISALYVNDSTVGGSLKVAVPTGARSVTVWLDAGGTLNGSVQVKYVNSNGDQSAVVYGYSFTSTNYSSTLNGAGSTAYAPIKYVIPPGTSYIIAVCTAYTSGSAAIRMAFSDDPCVDLISGTVAINANTARIGFLASSGVWYDDTTTALTASSTFTSTARDITAANTGSTFASASTYAKEYRVMAEQDVAFTLQIQASRDNSTFRIVESITAAAVPGGGFVASTSVLPMWRYYRYAIVNGGTNAARTTGGSILMAN